MRRNLVLTLTGPDQIGIVDRVTEAVLRDGGNVEASRMARLGGEFAVLMLVSVPAEGLDQLCRGILGLQDEGYAVAARETQQTDPARYAGWVPYQIEVTGADHEGIIHNITHRLAEHGINIESMDTGTVTASMSGTPLFTMAAVILVPPELAYRTLQSDLQNGADDLNVDIDVSPHKG